MEQTFCRMGEQLTAGIITISTTNYNNCAKSFRNTNFVVFSANFISTLFVNI